MESFLTRYRNITVLVLVICAQLVLLAVQVKSDHDVRLIRVWAVTAVTPLARVLEGVRSRTTGLLRQYVLMKDAQEENRRLREERDGLKMENQFLKAELSLADRVKALAIFQQRAASKTLAARVIGTGAGANSKMLIADRGSAAGVLRGMGVVVPDGIVGKIIATYPTASQVVLVTDATFAAGVVSQKNGVRGTLKGQGQANCKVDYVPNEVKVETGEWFYTSGDDRIFPKGFPVGQVRAVRPGNGFQEIIVEPAGLQHGLEAVLIVREGVHEPIPDAQVAATPVYVSPPPPPAEGAASQTPRGPGTEADRLRRQYQAVGEAQGHKFGEGLPGSKPPNFNLKIDPNAPPPAPGSRSPAPGAQPPAPDPRPRAPGPR